LTENPSSLLAALESEIRRLKVDFDRFFNGALPLPPDELRSQIRRQLREIRSHRLATFAERFHLNTLEARFNTLSELFNRKLRELERDGTAPAVRALATGLITSDGVVLDGSPDLKAVSALYNELYRSEGRRTKTDFDSFHAYLRQQIQTLKQRTGCERVRFRVTTTDGQPTLKAKPLTQITTS
jgi:hypothetical protein